MSDTEQRQMVYMPFLGLGRHDRLAYGRVQVINSADASSIPAPAPVLEKVQRLLRMHRSIAAKPSKAAVLSGIGLVVVGKNGFQPLRNAELAEVLEFRAALFLSRLAQNVRLGGPNSGHMVATSENSQVFFQNFTVASDYTGESAGAIVQRHLGGYKIDETYFPIPSFVPTPIRFDHNPHIMRQLQWLRRKERHLYRRIIQAVQVFYESYHNAPSVDRSARILLQVMAFEILLALPPRDQRKAFKDALQKLCDGPTPRLIRYKSPRAGGRLEVETRSIAGMWADRFYSLRNRIIHGEAMRSSDFMFRRTFQHFNAATAFFVYAIQRLIDAERERHHRPAAFLDKLAWETGRHPEDADEATGGFRLRPDMGRRFALWQERKAPARRRNR